MGSLIVSVSNAWNWRWMLFRRLSLGSIFRHVMLGHPSSGLTTGFSVSFSSSRLRLRLRLCLQLSSSLNKVLDRTNLAEINMTDKSISVKLPVRGYTRNMPITGAINYCGSGMRATVIIVSRTGRNARSDSESTLIWNHPTCYRRARLWVHVNMIMGVDKSSPVQ